MIIILIKICTSLLILLWNKCKGTSWMPSSVINAALIGITVNVAILNSYMDFNDYNTPIKTYVDDRTSFYLQTSSTKIVKIYAKLNNVNLEDDYLQLKSPSNKQFFSVDRINNDLGSYDTSSVAEVNIFLDPNRDSYQRTVFTILDLFGKVGGIFGLLTAACGFVVGVISKQIMLSSVFRRLYFTNHINFKNLKVKKIDSKRKVMNSIKEETKVSQNRKSTINSRIDDAKDLSEIGLQIEEREEQEETKRNNDFYLLKLQNMLKNRKRYQANWVHKILTYIPTCIWKYPGVQKK